MTTFGILMAALVGDLAWLAYVLFVVVPITVDALREMALRQSSSRLTALIEQRQIQVNSPDYWHAIESMIPPQ